jgi:hypothetical protein
LRLSLRKGSTFPSPTSRSSSPETRSRKCPDCSNLARSPKTSLSTRITPAGNTSRWPLSLVTATRSGTLNRLNPLQARTFVYSHFNANLSWDAFRFQWIAVGNRRAIHKAVLTQEHRQPLSYSCCRNSFGRRSHARTLTPHPDAIRTSNTTTKVTNSAFSQRNPWLYERANRWGARIAFHV